MSVSRYRFTLTPTSNVFAPARNKGTMLRGAFGYAFKAMACCAASPGSASACTDRCQDPRVCPYGVVFESGPPAGSDRLRLNQDVPRPFVMKPPLDRRTMYDDSTPLVFDIVLIGHGLDYLPYFVLAFRELGARGIGLRDARGSRGTATLDRVDFVHGDDSTEAVYRASTHVLSHVRPGAPETDVDRRDSGKTARVRIRLLTPTILKADGRIVDRPTFGTLMRRLRDRVNALASFHGRGPLDVDFRAFAARADAVRTVASDLQWESRSRLSSRRHVEHDLSGVIGWLDCEGDVGEFMPWLRLGELVHVGKNATFGNGWIDVERVTAGG